MEEQEFMADRSSYGKSKLSKKNSESLYQNQVSGQKTDNHSKIETILQESSPKTLLHDQIQINPPQTSYDESVGSWNRKISL